MTCSDGTTTTFYVARGAPKVGFVATSKTLTRLTLGGVAADFKDGEARVAVDPALALARSTALGVVSYGGRIDVPFVLDGPGGPYRGEVSLKMGDVAPKGWLFAAAKGSSILSNERKRPPRKAVLAAVRDLDATGGLIWGLFVQGSREEGDYSLLAQEIDPVAIDRGTRKVVGTCQYERSSDKSRSERDKIQIGADIAVYDRKTGKKLGSRAFNPRPHPGCSNEIQVGDGNFVNKADLFEIEQWLQTFLTDSVLDEALGGKYELPGAVGAPDLTALPAATAETLTRIAKGLFGIQRGMTPAAVAAILGTPNIDISDPKVPVRNYLDNAVSVIFELPADIAVGASVFAPTAYDKLHEKGLADPLLDLLGQPFDAVGKALGKPTDSYEDSYTGTLDTRELVTSLATTRRADEALRCNRFDVNWIVIPR